MLFSARASAGEMAGLFRRLGTSLSAGVDARTTFAREADTRGPGKMRTALQAISAELQQGTTVSDALDEHSDFFPQLACEMVRVGEESGKLAEVCRRLAEHYDQQVKLRRSFLQSITWPAIELSMALGVIGLVILIAGMLPKQACGKATDILGLGLIGVPGFLLYLMFLGMIAFAGFLLWRAIRQGVLWVRPIERALLLTPVVGKALQTLALARFAWSLQLLLDTGMDLLRVFPLALRSTQYSFYSQHSNKVVSDLRGGQEVAASLAQTGAFPQDFLDSVDVGEQSGRLPETMAVLAEDYRDRGQRAIATLTMVAGFLVWGLVALLIIMMIMRFALRYINMINNFANDPMNAELEF